MSDVRRAWRWARKRAQIDAVLRRSARGVRRGPRRERERERELAHGAVPSDARGGGVCVVSARVLVALGTPGEDPGGSTCIFERNRRSPFHTHTTRQVYSRTDYQKYCGHRHTHTHHHACARLKSHAMLRTSSMRSAWPRRRTSSRHAASLQSPTGEQTPPVARKLPSRAAGRFRR